MPWRQDPLLVPNVPIGLGRDIRDMPIACARTHPDANKHARHIPMYRPVHSAHANKCSLYEDFYARNRYQGQQQGITSHRDCRMELLVPLLDAFFWHTSPQSSMRCALWFVIHFYFDIYLKAERRSNRNVIIAADYGSYWTGTHSVESLPPHCSDVIMTTTECQITSVPIVCSTLCAGADHRKHQSSASLAFVRGIHRSPVN